MAESNLDKELLAVPVHIKPFTLAPKFSGTT